MVFPHPIVEDYPAIFVPTVFNAPESIVMDFDWNFGDGESSNRILTRHAYKKAGTYEVSFKVIDNYENVTIMKKIVRVIKK
jgi:PKD repeat protein